MRGWLFPMVVITMLVLSFWWSARIRRRREEGWSQFAAARQLGFSRGQIAGVLQGFTVAMLIEERGQGKSRHHVAVVRCSLNGALPPEFALEKEGLGDKLVQLLGKQDHQLGYPEMDSAFLLQNVGEQARQKLTRRSVQEALLEAVRQYPGMRIGNGVVQLETRDVPHDELGLSKLLGDALTVATALQR